MRILTVAAPIMAGMALALGTPALAQTSDAAKPAAAACQTKSGKCAPARAHKKAAGAEGMKAQSISQCRDVRTHRFTKCGGPYAEPVPAN